MTIPGYDPDDVDAALERLLAERDPAQYLTDAERARWEDGERRSDLLDDGDVRRLLAADTDERTG
jgi:hypothetical protein